MHDRNKRYNIIHSINQAPSAEIRNTMASSGGTFLLKYSLATVAFYPLTIMTMPKQNRDRFYSRCIPGLFIFFVVHHRPTKGDKFCGSDLEDAQNTCWQPCSTNDDCCASSLLCFETGSSCGSSDLTGTNHYFCGVT